MNPGMRAAVQRILRRLPPRLQARALSLRSVRCRPELGPGAYVHRSVQLLGKARIRIGANSVVSQDCWLNVNHRQGRDPAIDIGDNCFIGRRNFFSSGLAIRIGHFVLTANDCSFLGSTHVVSDPMQPVITTGTSSSDVIAVGANTFIGAGARLLGHLTVGHGCVVGAGSLITKDLPPFSQAHGVPASVHKRFSFLQKRWISVEQFGQAEESALPDEATYLSLLNARAPIQMPYIASGSDMGDC